MIFNRSRKAPARLSQPLWLGGALLTAALLVSAVTLVLVGVYVPRQLAQAAALARQSQAAPGGGTAEQQPQLVRSLALLSASHSFDRHLMQAVLQVDLSVQQCSGHGIFYASDATSGCNCWDCYLGPTCATEVPLDDCTLAAESGDPHLYESALAAA